MPPSVRRDTRGLRVRPHGLCIMCPPVALRVLPLLRFGGLRTSSGLPGPLSASLLWAGSQHSFPWSSRGVARQCCRWSLALIILDKLLCSVQGGCGLSTRQIRTQKLPAHKALQHVQRETSLSSIRSSSNDLQLGNLDWLESSRVVREAPLFDWSWPVPGWV